MQVLIVGKTNSGKSLLLSALTNAKPQISEIKFTTKHPEIGIMNYALGIKRLTERYHLVKGMIDGFYGRKVRGY